MALDGKLNGIVVAIAAERDVRSRAKHTAVRNNGSDNNDIDGNDMM